MAEKDTEEILETIRVAESTYCPSKEVADTLRDKTLVMIVGPVAVGKSYVISHLTMKDPDFKQVSIFTTRDARPGEHPEDVRSQPRTRSSLTQLQKKIQDGLLVQYTIHPTTGHIYGTLASDYKARYNLLPTLSGAVESRGKLPFADSVVILLVAKPETWQTWLNIRYPEKSDERAKRVNEAIISLRWGLSEERSLNVHWVENDIDHPSKAIEDIINIVKYKKVSDSNAKVCAEKMLEAALNVI